MSKSVFTTFEAAKICHVSPLSIINWVNAGRLAAFRTPGGHRRIRRDDLVRFMRENGMIPCIGTQRSPRGPRMGYSGMKGIARSTVGIVLAISVP